jgi:predicted 3-demethylubiquinone-9 3-methyltransferase (glyoxalase superfamily)
MSRITTNLWFDTEALEAAEYYVAIFPDSRVTGVSRYGDGAPRPAGTVLTVAFELDGQPYLALNGGPEFRFTEAISLVVNCADQDEVDHYWAALVAGGQPGQRGWLKDRYGLSWQIVPDGMGEVMGDPDPARAGRAMEAMMGMQKLDIAALRAAVAGPSSDCALVRLARD